MYKKNAILYFLVSGTRQFGPSHQRTPLVFPAPCVPCTLALKLYRDGLRNPCVSVSLLGTGTVLFLEHCGNTERSEGGALVPVPHLHSARDLAKLIGGVPQSRLQG